MSIQELAPEFILRRFNKPEKEPEPLLPPLRNYDDLPVGIDLPKEALKNKKVLDALHTIGRLVCLQQDDAAVAGTQIPESVYEQFGIPKTYTNWIYVQGPETDCKLSKVLVINPREIKRGEPKAVSLEGCGSIDNGETHMWIMRPTYLEIKGWFYRPGRLSHALKWEIALTGKEAAVFDHEMVHCAGLSAVQRGEIIDFLCVPDEEWGKMDSNYWDDHVKIPQLLKNNREKRIFDQWFRPFDGKLYYCYADGSLMDREPLNRGIPGRVH